MAVFGMAVLGTERREKKARMSIPVGQFVTRSGGGNLIRIFFRACRICGKSRSESVWVRIAGGSQAAIPNNRSMNRFSPRTSPLGNQRIWPFPSVIT